MNCRFLYAALAAFSPVVSGNNGYNLLHLSLRGGSDAVSVGISQAISDMRRKSGIFSIIKSGAQNGVHRGHISSVNSAESRTNNIAHNDLISKVSGIGENKVIISSGSNIMKTISGGSYGSVSPTHKFKKGKLSSPKKMKQTKEAAKGLPPASAYNRPLLFWENMICGAISRSVAQTIMHPANTMKTILQSRSQASSERLTLLQLARPQNLKLLTRGAGAQLILSVPHGAVNFAVLEFVRRQMSAVFEDKFGDDRNKIGPGLDFVSSAISTICCSVVSTPQMMITDNIMAGTYPNLRKAATGLVAKNGIKGLYTGWWPGLAGKIPSYGLTWVFFQQLKQLQLTTMKRDPKDIENSIMGCMASATTVCIMIPMDTIKTRLVTQANYPNLIPYKGIVDCAKRITAEEGMIAFYRGLAPRLVSVVPMIGIQFGVYEFMKKAVLANNAVLSEDYRKKTSYFEQSASVGSLEEIAMEVAADDDQPFPAPRRYDTKLGK